MPLNEPSLATGTALSKINVRLNEISTHGRRDEKNLTGVLGGCVNIRLETLSSLKVQTSIFSFFVEVFS